MKMPMAHTSNVFKSNEDVEGKGHTEQDIGSNQVKGQKGRERKKKGDYANLHFTQLGAPHHILKSYEKQVLI